MGWTAQGILKRVTAGRFAAMKTALKQLLDDLDRIMDEHEEVGDTEVRETMSQAIQQLWLAPDGTDELPRQFGMFSDAGDRLVHQALARFLAHPETLKLASGAATPQERLDAFQDGSISSDRGALYDEYFGHLDAL